MNHLFLILFLALGMHSSFVRADGSQAPPPATIDGRIEKGIFVDFKSAKYDITFDIDKKETRVHSIIQFSSSLEGFPIFDLADEPLSVYLDGHQVETQVVDLKNRMSSHRVVLEIVPVGEHTLVIDHKLTGLFIKPIYSDGTVNSGFFTLDNEGAYLQNYLPTTFEFSQYAMTFHVRVVGSTKNHVVFANGDVVKEEDSAWTIHYPPFYNSSASYFHIIPEEEVEQINFTFDNGAGGAVQGVAYQKKDLHTTLTNFVQSALNTFKNLSSRFGKYPHQYAVLYNSQSLKGGGMEYSGATITSPFALPHEIAHFYFGRGILPANGNAGWIDEALATYASRIGGLPFPDSLLVTNMAAHSTYFTKNDGLGYTRGLSILTKIGQDYEKVDSHWDSLEKFLKVWVPMRMYQTITTEMLKKDLETFTGLSLTEDFRHYVYGEPLNGPSGGKAFRIHSNSDFHPKLSSDELQKLQ